MVRFKLAGIFSALLWIMFGITLVIRLTAGNGGLLAAEMLRAAPPSYSGLPEREYPGVGAMTADYLTGRTETFQYVISDGKGGGTACFRAHEAAHMADCRDLIRLDTAVCVICGIAAAALTAAGMVLRKGWEGFLRGILQGLRIAGAVACALLVWALADFDGLFVTFHRIAFSNDGWLLNPYTDLLIRLMPAEFFIRLGIHGLLRALVIPAALETAARIGLKKRNAR